jgi:hypothetical protein
MSGAPIHDLDWGTITNAEFPGSAFTSTSARPPGLVRGRLGRSDGERGLGFRQGHLEGFAIDPECRCRADVHDGRCPQVREHRILGFGASRADSGGLQQGGSRER